MLEMKNVSKILIDIFTVTILISTFVLLSSCSFITSEEKILISISPNNAYTLEAYKVNGGATIDYSIKVYKLSNNTISGKTLIYNKYHEYDAEIKWINNDNVSINGIVLDLSKNERYDWREDLI